MGELIDAIKNGCGYTYISNNGYKFSRDELIDVIKEYDYAIHTMGVCSTKYDVFDAIAEELNERNSEE